MSAKLSTDGLLPDGKTRVARTRRTLDAFIAICEECGMNFDNDIPTLSLTQGVALHKGGIGHKRFTYYKLT